MPPVPSPRFTATSLHAALLLALAFTGSARAAPEGWINADRIEYHLEIETGEGKEAGSKDDIRVLIQGTYASTGEIRFKRFPYTFNTPAKYRNEGGLFRAVVKSMGGLAPEVTTTYKITGNAQAVTHTGRPVRITLTNPGNDDWVIGTVRIKRMIDGKLRETTVFEVKDSIGDNAPSRFLTITESQLKGKNPQPGKPQSFTLQDSWVVFNNLGGSEETRQKVLKTTFTKGIWDEKTSTSSSSHEVSVGVGSTIMGVDLSASYNYNSSSEDSQGKGSTADFSKEEEETVTMKVPEKTLVLQRQTWKMTGTKYTWGDLTQWQPDTGSIALSSGQKHEFIRDPDDETRLVQKHNPNLQISAELLKVAKDELGSEFLSAGEGPTSFRKQLLQKKWPGLPDDIGAAVDNGSGKTYFFKENRYWKWDNDAGKIQSGPVKISDGWPGLPRNIDAAVNADDEKFLFFKKRKVYSWDIESDTLDDGYPKLIKDEFPGIPARLDAAVRAGFGKGENCVLFFKGDTYWWWDLDTMKIAGWAGEAKSQDVSSLPGLPDYVDAATTGGRPYPRAGDGANAVFGRYLFLRQEHSWEWR